MVKEIFSRFGVRVTAAIVLSMLSVIVLSAALLYNMMFKSQFEDLRKHLKTLAYTAAINIDRTQLSQIPLTYQGIKTPAYGVIRDYIKRIKAANAQVKSIYILTKINASNQWAFIIDDDERDKYNSTCVPGLSYDAGRFPEMLHGYNEPSADTRIEWDEWGPTISGYAPIRDQEGKPIAMLGVDIDARDVWVIKERLITQTAMAIAMGIVLSLLLGFFISRRVVGPINDLIAGARYIGEGNLHHQVQVRGDDEIAQLSQSFNEMTASLNMSRKQILNYFFETVRSMVKVLEYRDPYTMGHSESVAKYANQIAQKMGINPDVREFFHNVCLLHDIGKVGIRDNVLLKPEQLSEEEWKSIQTHPVLGEQILKPILQDKLMLSVIRNHHERYDGKGYPDGLKEGQIPLLVAIATAADSYDAMTSSRSYREGLSKESAIEQLKKGRGTQFHPDVVDAFLEILSKET